MSSIVAEREADLERSSLEYVFNRYHDAWEAKDPDAIAALHSEDSSYALRAGEERVHGRAALREHYAKVFEQYPNYRADVARLILGAGHWVLEWTMVIDLLDTDGKPSQHASTLSMSSMSTKTASFRERTSMSMEPSVLQPSVAPARSDGLVVGESGE